MPVSHADSIAAAAVRPGSLRAWTAAARPRTLPVAFSPVLAGATLGFARVGAIDARAAAMAMAPAASLLMQPITNLQNDVGHTVRGGDRSGTRTGLPRATARGWLAVSALRAAIVAGAVVATALGLALVARRGWQALAIGTLSLPPVLAYMAGPWPIAYTPFGDLAAFVFFGLVAVTGTDWLLTGGAGGFISISRSACRLVFAGSSRAGAARLRVADGRLHNDAEGPVPKFVAQVEHLTVSGERARRRGRPVRYVTERGVFRLANGGWLEPIERYGAMVWRPTGHCHASVTRCAGCASGRSTSRARRIGGIGGIGGIGLSACLRRRPPRAGRACTG